MGAGKIHPSAKLRLFGLLMQAQQGNFAASDAAAAGANAEDETAMLKIPGLQGSALELQRLKLTAWRSEKDKDPKEAMKEYIEFLSSIAPQWKVAHFLGGHESTKDDKPRPMMWVFKLKVEKVEGEKSVGPSAFRVQGIEILQSSNATGAKLWSEEKLEEEIGSTANETQTVETDPFLAGLPTDLTIEDCLVDRTKHATIAEQRKYYAERMREMAHEGHDEEDGWEFFARTTGGGLEEDKQLDIYHRVVEWSPVKQLRTVVESEIDVDDFFGYLINGIDNDFSQSERSVVKKIAISSKALERSARETISGLRTVFRSDGPGRSCCRMMFRHMPFPW